MPNRLISILLLWGPISGFPSCALAQANLPEKTELPIPSYSADLSASVDLSAGATVELAQKETELRAALKEEPNSAGLLYALALALRQEGKPRESLDTYARAAQKAKPTAEELRSVALDYVLLSDYDDAIHWLEIAVQMDTTDTDILYSLGRCYYSKARYTDALKMYERVLALNPHHLKAEENLGLVYEMTNLPDKAEKAFRDAAAWASKDGPDEWPFMDLGTFLIEHNRAAEALEPLNLAVHIKPGSAACHEKLGSAMVASNDLTDGVRELERAVQLDPKDPKKHYQLGRALRQAGQVDRAKQEFAASQKLYATGSSE